MHTTQDNHLLPNTDEILGSLGGAHYLSALDLASGSYQILLAKKAKEITGCSTMDGHPHFRRLPQGSRNSPACSQRVLDFALGGLIGSICSAYLDDIIVFGRTLKEHDNKLRIVLQHLREFGMVLQTDKCEYLRPELEYLGHIITKDGVGPNPREISAVKEFKEPKNEEQIQQFLGLTGYYRQFIRDSGQIAESLTQLLKKDSKFE